MVCRHPMHARSCSSAERRRLLSVRAAGITRPSRAQRWSVFTETPMNVAAFPGRIMRSMTAIIHESERMSNLSDTPPSRIGITPPADPTAWMDDLTTMHEDRRFDALHNSPDVASLCHLSCVQKRLHP